MSTIQEQQVKQQGCQQGERAPATPPIKIAPRLAGAEKQTKKSHSGAGGWRSVHMQRAQVHYPQVFNRRAVRPVKVGIRADMLADAEARRLPLTPKQISLALAALTKTPIYLRAIVAGGPRYDLNGQLCGEVTAEQRENARVLLAGLRSTSKKKRALQQVRSIGE